MTTLKTLQTTPEVMTTHDTGAYHLQPVIQMQTKTVIIKVV